MDCLRYCFRITVCRCLAASPSPSLPLSLCRCLSLPWSHQPFAWHESHIEGVPLPCSVILDPMRRERVSIMQSRILRSFVGMQGSGHSSPASLSCERVVARGQNIGMHRVIDRRPIAIETFAWRRVSVLDIHMLELALLGKSTCCPLRVRFPAPIECWQQWLRVRCGVAMRGNCRARLCLGPRGPRPSWRCLAVASRLRSGLASGLIALDNGSCYKRGAVDRALVHEQCLRASVRPSGDRLLRVGRARVARGARMLLCVSGRRLVDWSPRSGVLCILAGFAALLNGFLQGAVLDP